MTYYFSVLNLELSCTNSKKSIISDSVEFHTAHFTFDSQWDGYGITVFFTNSKTGVSISMVLDINNECLIPYEALVPDASEDYLIVGAFGVNGTSKMYTHMNNPLLIIDSNKADSVVPIDPTPSVYDQIMQEFANRYVDAIYIDKIIPLDDWQTISGINTITPLYTPTIVTGATETMVTGNLVDYLNETSYPYIDFYLFYSTDGINAIQSQATSQTVATSSQRKIQFIIGTNEYEVRITATNITIKRTSGTTDYYIHNLSIRFDDYFYYAYQVSGLTQNHRSTIIIKDPSREAIRDLAINRYQEFINDTVQIFTSQLPTADIETKFFAFKTNQTINLVELSNIFGTAYYANVCEMSISDLTTECDNQLATIAQIKEYVNSKII